MYGRRRPRSKLTRLKSTDPVAHGGTCGTSPRSCTWLPRRPRCACAHRYATTRYSTGITYVNSAAPTRPTSANDANAPASTADRSTGDAAPVPTTANPTTPASGARWTEKVEESSRSTWSGSGRERSACLGPANPDVQKDSRSTRSGSARERCNLQRHGEPGRNTRPAPTQLGSWSTGEPTISRHRTLPCQCDKCATYRVSQHPTGEIDEWGDNLVQRDRYDLTEGEEDE